MGVNSRVGTKVTTRRNRNNLGLGMPREYPADWDKTTLDRRRKKVQKGGGVKAFKDENNKGRKEKDG